MQGLWILVDGGYHRWKSLIHAHKHDRHGDVGPWAEWMESVRKDIECVFGILKKRHRILRLPFQQHTEGRIDAVFRTCCIMHNQLLEIDGRADIGEYEKDWVSRDIEATDKRPEDENFR